MSCLAHLYRFDKGIVKQGNRAQDKKLLRGQTFGEGSNLKRPKPVSTGRANRLAYHLQVLRYAELYYLNWVFLFNKYAKIMM